MSAESDRDYIKRRLVELEREQQVSDSMHNISPKSESASDPSLFEQIIRDRMERPPPPYDPLEDQTLSPEDRVRRKMNLGPVESE